MLRFKARATAVFEVRDSDTFMVIASENADGSGARLEVQRRVSAPDAQDIALQQDTYCLSVDTAATHYGGITAWSVRERVLTIVIDEAASKTLGIDGGFVIELDTSLAMARAVEEGMRLVTGERSLPASLPAWSAVTFAPPHSLVCLWDESVGEVPESRGGRTVVATSTCVTIGTLTAADGPTRIALASVMPNPADPPRLLLFDGEIETPEGEVMLVTTSLDRLLGCDVAGTRARVRVLGNDPKEPDEIEIIVEAISGTAVA